MEITPYLTAIMAIIGMIVGTLISPKVTQKVSTEHNRLDLLFKKKLEYFEKITETIEENKRLYKQIIGKLEEAPGRKKTEDIIKELKQKRKNLLIKSSPLYFDTRIFSEKIIHLSRIEKEFFHKIGQLREKSDDRDEVIENLKECLKRMNIKEREIIIEMKKELVR